MYPYDSNPYQQSQNLIQNQLLQSLNPTPQQPIQRHVTKVNGRAGAEAFSLSPNSDDILLDMNDPIIYFVQTDGAGYKSITAYDISVHKEVSAQDRYKTLDERITKLEEAMKNGKSNFTANATKSKPSNINNDAGYRGNDKG